MAIRVRNWHKFQHFKDRKPPWIKLYRDILDDILWHELDADAAKCLVSCWLIASEHDGYLPSYKELAFRLRTTEKSIKSNVSKLSSWLEQIDINAISDNTAISAGYQEARLETETETEKRQRAFALPDWIPEESWKGYVEMRVKTRKPMTDRAKGMIVKQLETLKAQGHDPVAVLAQSEVHNWADVYAIKPNGGNGGNGGSHTTPKLCAGCERPIVGGTTSMSIGVVCNSCYTAYLDGRWTGNEKRTMVAI